MLARSPPARLEAIQWLRALAALAIAVHHGLHEAARAGGAPSLQGLLPLEAGVDLFFVISGFVMVHAGRDLFGDRRAILPFLRRRLARIVPIYWAATALFLATMALGGTAGRPPPGWQEVVASLLFIPYGRPDGVIQPVYGLGWTLNYEILFYVLFALALPWARERAVPVLVGVLMALVALGQWLPQSPAAPWFWTRPIVLEFGFGVLIGHMALSGVRPSGRAAAGLVLCALALLALGRWAPALLPDRALLYGLPAALLVIAALAVEDRPRGAAARLAGTLGDASYALYLLHPFVLRGLALATGAALAGPAPLLFVLGGVTLAAIVAMVAWFWFERPLTRRLQGRRH